MGNIMTVDEAKAELSKIIDTQIFTFGENGDLTLFLICSHQKISDEINTIISFNKFEVDYSKNEYGEYTVILVFIDGKFEIPISTGWTNESYHNFRLFEDGKGIYFVNTALKTSNGFNLPSENKIKFIKHKRKESL
jgi:hypothetical protein